MQNNRTVGTNYERIAAEYLERKGYEILACNYRCRMGEIDLIARDHTILVFVEVKYRSNACKGNPLEAITKKKQKVISRCANHFLVCSNLYNVSCRFDAIGILNGKIQHIENAFEYLS